MNKYSNRAIKWMQALKYLPEQVDQYENHLLKMNNLYKQYVEEFTKASEIQILAEIETYCAANNQKDGFEQQKRKIIEKYMNYELYVKNEFLHTCLEKDAPRTWQQQFNSQINENIGHYFYSDDYKARKGNYCQYDILRRILYIYGRLNPAIGYTSGMNYVLAPLLFVIKNEADCFFCFTIIMSQLYDVFILKEGNNVIKEFEQKLKDIELYDHLENIGLNANMYCLNWFKTCFALNFPLEITLSIWDRMLETNDFRKFQIDLAIKMISSIDVLNFEEALQILSNNNLFTNI